MTPVFVGTWEYHPSYYDYWKLVQLSGYPIIMPEDVDLRKKTIYVFTGTRTEFRERQERLGNLKARDRNAILVYYQIERPDSGPGEIGQPLDRIQKGHMDRFLQEFDIVWMPYGHLPNVDPRILYVLMGSHPGLREAPLSGNKDYDLAILANMTERPHRAALVPELEKRYKIAWTAHGQERARILASSRAQFAIHQTPSPLPEPQRLAFGAAYELPYLSDTNQDQAPLEEGCDFLSAPLESILDSLDAWMKRPDLPEIGRNLHRRLVLENPFPDCISRGVRETLLRLGRA